MSTSHMSLPEGSAYADLPEPLRETIVRSFADRIAGQPGAQDNLMFGFRDPAPQSPWVALDYLGAMAVNLLVQLYDRIEGIDATGETWRQIRWIRNQWWGGSAGIKVVYWNPAEMRFRLDGLLAGRHGNRVARDKYIGSLDHQLTPSHTLIHRAINPFAEPPDADTWREVDQPMKTGVHFCVGKSDLQRAENVVDRHPALDDIHLDWSSPVEGIEPDTGRCNYVEPWEGAVAHWFQAHFGHGAPVFTFDVIEKNLTKGHEILTHRTNDPHRDRFQDFAERWEKEKRQLAVRGKAGYELSVGRHEELEAILRALGEEPATK